MKTLKHFLCSLFVITSFFNCDNDDNNPPSRSTESIKVIIDNGTPKYYNNNIIAKEYTLPPTSGYSCEFKIESEDTSGNQFVLNLGKNISACPVTFTTPISVPINAAAVAAILTISGITFDTSATSTINFTITNFDTTLGGDIDISFNGTYYQVSDPNPHTLDITIHVHRD